jgi:hypothetical protein
VKLTKSERSGFNRGLPGEIFTPLNVKPILPGPKDSEAYFTGARGIERTKIFRDDKDLELTEVGSLKSEV